MTARTRQHGFSLLEVLVAFAILSVSLGVLLQAFATGLRNAGMADDYTQATLYAESILAAYGREQPLREGVREGPINDRFAWRGAVSAYAENMPDPEKTRMRAWRISVQVFWRGLAQTRSVTLETLRLTPLESPEAR
ncbi:MAG TPA: type II secretion system protein [Candidatus Contendobacter sp.]|nr:type II secretion system protein [Candidatus Contendobacter sp.]HRZ24174.1 type II secretion system protein [Candidatus Contendobacter sp.]HRZ53234.1 type II secretion system protein [Candidatus Contendobacter sp.]